MGAKRVHLVVGEESHRPDAVWRRETMIRFGIALAVLAGAAVSASAVPISVWDRNSQADFNNPGGQVNWLVDGVDQVFNQRFYYRTALMADESPVDSLPALGPVATDTNPFSDNRVDTAAYQFNDIPQGLEFEVSFKLRGGLAGSGNSDLAETIIIRNVGAVAQTVSFFQYVDFDLGNSIGGDMAWIEDGRVAYQNEVGGGIYMTETVAAPAPDFFEVGIYPNTLNRFGNGVADTLSNNAGPVVGDATWAFQWNFVVAPGSQFTISKDKLIVPTPGALALLGLGGLVAGRRRR